MDATVQEVEAPTLVSLLGAAALVENERLLLAIDRVAPVLHGAGISNVSRAEHELASRLSVEAQYG